MQGVLIDDHRIHVDFSQSVSRLSDTWRTATNSKRRHGGGGFGGVSGLEKKRQYKDESEFRGRERRDRYGMVYDEDELRKRHEKEGRYNSEKRERSRSRSPQRERVRDERVRESRDDRRGGRGDDRDRGGRGRDRDRDRY